MFIPFVSFSAMLKFFGGCAFLLSVFWADCSCAQFSDDFSDGNFTHDPPWFGDDTIFDATANTLHLVASPVASEAYLSTHNQAIENASWEFLVTMDFNPSGNNFSRVYLVSDQPVLKGALNGYYVEMGGVHDNVSLYRQDGVADFLLIEGAHDRIRQPSVHVRVLVTRDHIGNWELRVDSLGGSAYLSEGTVFENTYLQNFYSGVYCVYTASRSDKFGFDAFVVTGTAFTDTVAPVIRSTAVVSDRKLDVYFSEPILRAGAEITDHYLADNHLGAPVLAELDQINTTLVHLTFDAAFQNGVVHHLQVFNVQDLSGNSIVPYPHPFMYFVPDTAVYRDVVINEIMADETPEVGLPDVEYIEIHNRTNKYFELDGWTFSDGSSTARLSPYLLAPGAYLVVVDPTDSARFIHHVAPNTIGVSSFPTLNNAEDHLTLRNGTGLLVDQVNYSSEWYRDDAKNDGGWSLELINPDLPCSGPFNWMASGNEDGGTPGIQNSVYDTFPDTKGPSLIQAMAVAADRLLLVFDEPLDTTSVIRSTYAITNGYTVVSASPVQPGYDRVDLTISPNLVAGVQQTIHITGITDCTGNHLFATEGTFVLPQTPEVGDVIINEVLFNPRNNGVDFVEIYNHSNKVLNLENWQLANFDNDTIANFKSITHQPLLFFPGTYFLLTTNGANIVAEYPNTRWARVLEMTGLPAYGNDSSTVYLINALNRVSDHFSYHEGMQFGLLNDPDGISLERIDFNRPTNDATNWHSAAENVGFATPGFENSQYFPATLPEDAVTLEPPVFSPDNDGFQDVLNINYELDGPGYVGSIAIFDVRGRLIRKLLQNELLATRGAFSWDGTTDHREKARIGTYVVYFEVFGTSGNVTSYKRVAVLGGRL